MCGSANHGTRCCYYEKNGKKGGKERKNTEKFRSKGEKEEDREEISDGLEERSKVIFTLMDINDGFKDTKLYYNFRNDVVQSQKNRLKKGHILLRGTNATLFGNGPEMLLQAVGKFDKTKSVLKPGTIRCESFNNNIKYFPAKILFIIHKNIKTLKELAEEIYLSPCTVQQC